MPRWSSGSVAVLWLACAAPVLAQRSPDLGYIFPPGGRAGTTIEVQLGGYDWTPDMEFFVHDPRIQLTAAGPPGELLIPPPPYWFGPKSKIAALPIPRETAARLMIPADCPSGPVRWQAANANGGTATGIFIVSDGREIVEQERHLEPVHLFDLPVTISGRLSKNEEVDIYRVSVAQPGFVTCELAARQLGSNFHGVIEVRDAQDRLLADIVDTEGEDAALTFAAPAAGDFLISIRDIDHAGDRSFVYRLTITPGPRVLGAIPAAGRAGETKSVEFIGLGVATGARQLESVTREITFPAGPALDWNYRLDTPFGIALSFRFQISELPEVADAPRTDDLPHVISVPSGITGVLNRPFAEDRYAVTGNKGDVWSLYAASRRSGLPLDLVLTIFSPEGKQLAQNDDLPGSADAGLDFVAPADGAYQIVVSDKSGQAGARDAVYRLTIQSPSADFHLQTLQRLNLLIGEKTDLLVKAVRTGGFAGPIQLAFQGLPAGVRPDVDLVIPADKQELKIPLQVAADAVASAAVVTLTGTATIGDVVVTHFARGPAAGSLIVHHPREHDVSPMLVSLMLRPRFKGHPVDQDTVRKVHRGTTFPADVIVERLEGYTGEILLRMAAHQVYQVQGITGGDVLVPPGVEQAIYPCYMPEWLETSRTSRMAMIGEIKIPDVTGRVRHQVVELTGKVTMTMEGALLKLSSPARELTAHPGMPFDIPLKISRSSKLPEPAQIELRLPPERQNLFFAEPLNLTAGTEETVLRVTSGADSCLTGVQTLSVRATVLEKGRYPAISETTIEVEFPNP